MTNKYHQLLLRQLKRSGIDLENNNIPAEYLELLNYVSKAYNESDQGRYIIDRSMEISSMEMLHLRETLQKEKEIMQAVMSEGLCVIDPFWKISNLNQTGAVLLCSTPQSVIGKIFSNVFTLHDNINGKLTTIDIDLLHDKFLRGEIYHCEKGLLKKVNGVTHPVSFSMNPLPLINNKIFGGAVLVFKDISDRLESEHILMTSLKAAENSNKAKTQFLANMSHEIRTPMNGILGMLQLLLHTSLNDTQKNYATKCFESANSLLRIIGDILDFTKIEAGKVEFESREFNIKNEFETMIVMFSSQCEEKKLSLKLTYDDNIPVFVKGDDFRMKQVITNLVNNAIKFTPANGQINIIVKANDIKSDYLLMSVSVSDTGIGIPQDMHCKIFDVFSQADESTTRMHGGTGLGLAICKHLVENMGGTIDVKSEVGKGSTFTFTMKFSTANKSSTAKAITEAVTLPQFKANILLVEDNMLNQIVVNDMLKLLGCNIDTVNTGKEAIEAVQHQKYDIILMDCHMPVMDGFKATESIRKIEKDYSSPEKKKAIIVALTANTLKGTKERCLEAGMDDYITKPINYSVLCSTLVQHLPSDVLQGMSPH